MINYLVEEVALPPLLKLTYTETYTPQTNPLCIDYIPELENGIYVKKVANGEVVDRPKAERTAYLDIHTAYQSNRKQWLSLYFKTFTFDGAEFLLDRKSIWYYEHVRHKGNVDVDIPCVDGLYTLTSSNKDNFILAYETKMKEVLELTNLT